MAAATAPGGFPTTNIHPVGLHATVYTSNGTPAEAALFLAYDLLVHLPLIACGASGPIPNRTWDDALATLGRPRVGQWLHDESANAWYAEVAAPGPAENYGPSRP
jgi:hypothetical protein